jgi:alpha-D-xyloside xylohydrolase
MVRTLFFEFPEDPTSWFIEDEYLFGDDLLVAPLFEKSDRRKVYLPPGGWFDYQTGERHLGGRWHTLQAGPIPCIILVRDGAVLPHIKSAQSTAFLDWSHLDLRVFSSTETARGFLCLPQDGVLRSLRLKREGGVFRLPLGVLPPRVKARIL